MRIFMILNLKDTLIFFIKLIPQLTKFNTLTRDWIPLPALEGIGVYFVHSQSHYKSVVFNLGEFWFWRY